MSDKNESSIDLGLSLGPTSNGAGANAASAAGTALAPPGPVSDPVWSPHGGLVRCADLSPASRRPFLPEGIVRVDDAAASSKKDDADQRDENKVDVDINLQFCGKPTESARCNHNTRFQTYTITRPVMSIAIPLSPEPQKLTQPLVRCPQNSSSHQESDDEVTSAPGKVIENKIIIPIPNRGPFKAPNEANSSCKMSLLGLEKGKGKVLSNGCENKGSSNGSRESAESHNSSRVCSRGIKRLRNEQVGRSKMGKRQIQESRFFSRHGSSFVNWISNVMKGRSVCNEKLVFTSANDWSENPMDDSTSNNNGEPDMGFRTMFQSLYHLDKKDLNSTKYKDCCESDERKELMVEYAENHKDNSCKQIILSDKPSSPYCLSCKETNSAGKKMVLDDPKVKDYVPEKSSQPVTGLWITRLYTKTTALEEGNLDKRRDFFEARDDPAQEIQRFAAKGPDDGSTSVETLIASVFAKRMGALKNILNPLDKTVKNSTCRVVCYFCGKNGHDLRNCPELTEAELEELLTKIISFTGIEKEYSCLCIACFDFGHWAIKCSSRGQFRKIIQSDSGGNQKISACDFANVENEGGEKDMLRAVRKLRLSRSDIIRWMNSEVSLSGLNGFFLRLRLRKSEARLEGSGYYVAQIADDREETICGNSKKPILVDVGGFKLYVESQYVSNHDFLEDEIAAWLGRIGKAGGKIPSVVELESKVEDKTSLGF